MRITITKGEDEDRIEAVRADGSSVSTRFPHKGPVPHDAVHFHVESALAIRDAFWGMVAAGKYPQEIADIAKVAGHASAKRAEVPDASIVPLLQAERLVECFEADMWSGGETGPEVLRDTIAAACAQSLVPPVEIADDTICAIQSQLKALLRRWPATAAGEQLVLDCTWTAA